MPANVVAPGPVAGRFLALIMREMYRVRRIKTVANETEVALQLGGTTYIVSVFHNSDVVVLESDHGFRVRLRPSVSPNIEWLSREPATWEGAFPMWIRDAWNKAVSDEYEEGECS